MTEEEKFPLEEENIAPEDGDIPEEEMTSPDEDEAAEEEELLSPDDDETPEEEETLPPDDEIPEDEADASDDDDSLLDDDDVPPLLLLDEEDDSENADDTDSDEDEESDGDDEDSAPAESETDGDAETPSEEQPKKHIWKKVLLIVLIVLIVAGGAVGGGLAWYYRPLPVEVPGTEEQPLEQPVPEEEPAVDLDMTGSVLTPAEAVKAMEDAGVNKIYCTIKSCGLEFSSTATVLDYSEAEPKIVTMKAVKDALAAMPFVEKVIFPSKTPLSYEQLDEFNKSLENVRVVWYVWMGDCALPTDTTYFCKNTYDRGFVGSLQTEDFEPLRYCTDLVALDIGHGEYTDISFLEPLTNLRYLILADSYYNDISVLANLPNLYYLELFLNKIDDISVLEQLTNLRYLNIGNTRGYDDWSVLTRMPWLEYLWDPCNSLTDEDRDEITSALPNTVCYLPGYDDGSVGGGWHQTPGYYEMRDALHMPYMD